MNLRKTGLLTSVVGLLATVAMAVQAEEPLDQDAGEAPAFEELDKNSDGTITPTEAQESWLSNAFAQVDVNRDGYISKAEYDEATS